MPISGFPVLLSVNLVLILSESSAVKYKKEEKNTLLAAMQPQNFLKAINGQAVDSYSVFFFCPLTRWKGGLPDLRVSDAELQRCGRKVCACMQCAVCVPLQLLSVCRMA